MKQSIILIAIMCCLGCLKHDEKKENNSPNLTLNIAAVNEGQEAIVGVEVLIAGNNLSFGGLSSGIEKTNLSVEIDPRIIEKGEAITVNYFLISNKDKQIVVKHDLLLPAEQRKNLKFIIKHGETPSLTVKWE